MTTFSKKINFSLQKIKIIKIKSKILKLHFLIHKLKNTTTSMKTQLLAGIVLEKQIEKPIWVKLISEIW